MRRFCEISGLTSAWNYLWARRSIRTKIVELVALPLIVGAVGGIIGAKYIAWSNRAHLRTETRADKSSWSVAFSNLGDVPAQNLLAHFHFSEPVQSHSQTSDVFTSAGQYISSNTFFSGQDDVTLQCPEIPAHKRYQLIFVFENALNTPPDIDVSISNGRVVEH